MNKSGGDPEQLYINLFEHCPPDVVAQMLRDLLKRCPPDGADQALRDISQATAMGE